MAGGLEGAGGDASAPRLQFLDALNHRNIVGASYRITAVLPLEAREFFTLCGGKCIVPLLLPCLRPVILNLFDE